MAKLSSGLVIGLALFLSSPSSAQTPVWTQFPNSPAGTARNDDIFFTDLTNGWSARGTEGVYRTTNGGQSWIKVIANTNPVAHFRSIGFASPTRGWAGNLGPGSYDTTVTDTNLLYQTFDGGVSWSVVPDQNATDMKGFCAMQIRDPQHIYGVGRVRGPAHFTKTEDGGATWFTTNLTAAGVMGGLMDVYFHDAQNGFVVGMDTNAFNSCVAPFYHGAIARTTNGGLTWLVVANSSVNCSYFWKMSWPTPAIGYASLQQNGSYSTVIFYKTTDGGATWSSNGIPLSAIGASSFGLQGIGFISATEGWMGGSTVLNPPFSFIHTTDGGLTWTPEGYNNTRAINRIRFASPTLGYMSGQALHVYHIPLAISAPPTNQTVALGATVLLTATAQGTAPIGYQWRFNGTNLAGATANSLTITSFQATNAGGYDLVISDFSGFVTSTIATLSVSGVPTAPFIVAQPQDALVGIGSNATFTVTAGGTLPLAYQWRFNSTNLTGATNASFTRTNFQLSAAGNYSVRITNVAGSVGSADARLGLGFSDNFDSYPTQVLVTTAGPTNGYRIYFRGASGVPDFKAIFGFDYSTVTYPTNIPPAPHSGGANTKGLFLTVNKDATAAAAAVNLYPLGLAIGGNFALKFDLWINWADLNTSTEHTLFGINHSGAVTNRIGQSPSDGLFFAMEGEDDSTATSTTLRDYSVFRGGGSGPPVLLLPSNTAFGPAPLLGSRFDCTDPGFLTLFPAKTIPGYGTTPAGSAGLGWLQGEIRQVNNLITWLLNGTAVAQYSNSSEYTNGTILLGYNDNFSSIGDSNNFAIFDNIQVEAITVSPVRLVNPFLSGSYFGFSFATEAYESYTIQWTTNLDTPIWNNDLNLVGTGGTNTFQFPIPVADTVAKYFRVSRP